MDNRLNATSLGVWKGIKKRCNSKGRKEYANYGGRGIRVCDRWLGPDGYKSFLLDMGAVPVGMTLERKDNDGDYGPENCYWATWEAQTRNRRTNKLILFQGVEKPMIAWAEIFGVPYNIFRKRLGRGWSMEKAALTPH